MSDYNVQLQEKYENRDICSINDLSNHYFYNYYVDGWHIYDTDHMWNFNL